MINKKTNSKKAQFFIISAVIVASILLIASRNLSDLGSAGLSSGAEMVEFGYIGMIKQALYNAAKASACDRIGEDISATENFLSTELAKRGIGLSAKHQIISCGSVKFDFNISSGGFSSSTEFWYP